MSSVASPRSLPRTPPHPPPHRRTKKHRHRHQQQKFPFGSSQRTIPIRSLMIGAEEIAGIAHNKVLVAATLAAAIGQLSKPLTSAIRGKGIDVKAGIRSGGMPSTHSAGVVAAAASLALERGFSDSVFGMSVVFAAIVMYDAQGVRREVGRHAEILNRILLNIQEKPTLNQEEEGLVDSKPVAYSIKVSEKLAPLRSRSEKANSYAPDPESCMFRGSRVSSKLGLMRRLTIEGEEPSEKIHSNYYPLSESVGHTKIQILVGALLGFVVSLSIDTIL